VVANSLIAFLMLAPNWAVGNHLQLTWGGNDYVPIGLQVEANSPQIAEAKAAGIKDFNLEVPASGSWKDIATKMGDSHYFLSVTSSLPAARGTIVQPQYYRINGVKNSQTVTCRLPGAERALLVVALARDGSVISTKNVEVKNGILKTDVRAAADSDQVILVYPFGESLEMEDLWERLDERRDQILRQVRVMGPQPGLRGILNPLGATPFLANRDNGFIPSSPTFQAEFAAYLEDKYSNVLTLLKSWYMQTGDIESFKEASQLVPLWNGNRGVKALYSQKRNLSFLVENTKKSAFWTDLAESISKTRVRRVHRIIRSIRKASSVPVFQEWAGWSWFFENPENELTGLSVRLNKFTPSGLLTSLSGAMSSNLRGRNPGPIFAVDVPYSADLDQSGVLEDMNTFGIRGLFMRATKPDDLPKIAKVSLGNVDTKPSAIYFPVNATNPAFVQKLPGNILWLPSPADGNRLDLGHDLSGYQISDGKNISYVIWGNGARTNYDFLLLNPGSVTVKGLSGVAPVVKITKTGMQIEMDHSPVLLLGAAHFPVPTLEVLRMQREIGNLFAVAASQHKDTGAESIEFRNFQELLTAAPVKAYALEKKVQRSLNSTLTGVVWVEFESTSTHVFSDVVSDAGCSNGACLTLKTPLAEATGPIYAKISVPQRSTGNMDMWIAARIPNPADRANIRVKIGGQILQLSPTAMSPYGSGFAWYQLGTTRLPSFKTDITVEVAGNSSTDIALDCLVLSPTPFQPNNVQIPELLVGPPPGPTGKTGKNGKGGKGN
jgi:hypothetical protein